MFLAFSDDNTTFIQKIPDVFDLSQRWSNLLHAARDHLDLEISRKKRCFLAWELN